MTILIGSARSDEHGKYSGGQRGDQRQTSSPDYAGEVSVQAFYMHSKGWYILRPKEASVAVGIAAAMQAACNNKNIGYSQSDRYAILKVGTGTKTPTNADCSSLVRQCVKEASGKDPGDFTTGTEVAALGATGLFSSRRRSRIQPAPCFTPEMSWLQRPRGILLWSCRVTRAASRSDG